MTTNETLTGERADLLEALGKQRYFLLHTAQGLTDEQAGTRTTVSELCIGGLIKHVARTEAAWLNFIERGTEAMEASDEAYAAREDEFRLVDGETLAAVVAEYEQVSERSTALLSAIDLDAAQALPEAPWFEPGARWSARRVFAHILAETAQHAGHADILREAIDNQKSM